MRSACSRCTKNGACQYPLRCDAVTTYFSTGDHYQLTIMAWMPELTKTNIQIGGDM